jgi:hypothetical protein
MMEFLLCCTFSFNVSETHLTICQGHSPLALAKFGEGWDPMAI